MTLADARVTQPSLRRSYLVPSYTTADQGVAEALDVLAEILGGGATSRLYRQLVVDKGIATKPAPAIAATRIDDTPLRHLRRRRAATSRSTTLAADIDA